MWKLIQELREKGEKGEEIKKKSDRRGDVYNRLNFTYFAGEIFKVSCAILISFFISSAFMLGRMGVVVEYLATLWNCNPLIIK